MNPLDDDDLDEEIPWPAFADAVTALLFVFIATTFFFMFRLEQQRQSLQAQEGRLKGAEQAAGILLEGARLCLNAQDHTEVRVRPVIEASSRTMALYIEPTASRIVEWFPVCSADVSDEAALVLGMVRRCLAEHVPARAEEYTVVLTLEGHTDGRAPGRNCRQRYPSNWELSGARSGAALRRLLCADGQCDETEQAEAKVLRTLSQDRSQLQIIAAGRAETVPAVRALCDPDWPGASTDAALDQTVCALLEDPEISIDAATASLQEALSGALPGLGESPTRDELVVAWANDPRCASSADPSGSCAERYRRLRRVDMRVDFRPRTTR